MDVGALFRDHNVQLVLQNLSRAMPAIWEAYIGLYFQETERNPGTIGGADALCADWTMNLRSFDRFVKEPNFGWTVGQVGPLDRPSSEFLQVVGSHGIAYLEIAIRQWAKEQSDRVPVVLNKAGWFWRVTRDDYGADWDVMDTILQMEEGEDKVKLMAQAKAESPRFFQHCVDSWISCGV